MMPLACGSCRYPSPPRRCGRRCGRNRLQGGWTESHVGSIGNIHTTVGCAPARMEIDITSFRGKFKRSFPLPACAPPCPPAVLPLGPRWGWPAQRCPPPPGVPRGALRFRSQPQAADPGWKPEIGVIYTNSYIHNPGIQHEPRMTSWGVAAP